MKLIIASGRDCTGKCLLTPTEKRLMYGPLVIGVVACYSVLASYLAGWITSLATVTSCNALVVLAVSVNIYTTRLSACTALVFRRGRVCAFRPFTRNRIRFNVRDVVDIREWRGMTTRVVVIELGRRSVGLLDTSATGMLRYQLMSAIGWGLPIGT
jgi:hypothetical protein